MPDSRAEHDDIELHTRKNLGVTFTPPAVAGFLAEWAIRDARDVVLDPGAGQGAFLHAARSRLIDLGAKPAQASRQVHGIEFRGDLSRDLAGTFPNLVQGDLFEREFPGMDAVIGNPPYVIRHRVPDPARLMACLAKRTRGLASFGGQTDLCCYFLAYAASFLRDGGRLAVIVSDSWLDMAYGRAFKRFLLDNFQIHSLVAFDERVFSNALVRSVLLLAERKVAARGASVRFFRLGGSDSVSSLVRTSSRGATPAPHHEVAHSSLDPGLQWGIYLKHPDLHEELTQRVRAVPLFHLAQTRIGLQTLARKFYILDVATAAGLRIEKRFLEPIAVSPRDVPAVAIDREIPLGHVLLLCSRTKHELKGTHLLEYIRRSERTEQNVRTRTSLVRGFQELPRLRRTGRDPWYNLKDEVQRRGRYPILVPRRVFGSYNVVWNRGRVVANEDFLEVNPRTRTHVLALLAILNSLYGEFVIRSAGHVYGGGVCNLNPNDLKLLPVPDLTLASSETLRDLATHARRFLQSGGRDREGLSDTVMRSIGLHDESIRRRLREAVADLQGLSTRMKGVRTAEA